MAGIVFCKVIQDDQLQTVVTSLTGTEQLTETQINSLEQFAKNPALTPPVESVQNKALLNMARAASPSPSTINKDIVQQCQSAQISAQGIVEMVTWLAVLQMMHRLSSYLQYSGSNNTV